MSQPDYQNQGSDSEKRAYAAGRWEGQLSKAAMDADAIIENARPKIEREAVLSALDDSLREAERWEADADVIESSQTGTRRSRAVAAETLRACAAALRAALDGARHE